MSAGGSICILLYTHAVTHRHTHGCTNAHTHPHTPAGTHFHTRKRTTAHTHAWNDYILGVSFGMYYNPGEQELRRKHDYSGATWWTGDHCQPSN